MTDDQHRIRRTLLAGTRGLLLTTTDESRALDRLESIGEALGWPVHVWTAASGLDRGGGTQPLAELLHELRARDDEAIFVALDGLAQLRADPRPFREIAQRTRGPAVCIVHPRPDDHVAAFASSVPELWLETHAAPSPAELSSHIEWIASVLETSGYPGAHKAIGAAAQRLARASLGLPRSSLDRLIAEAVIDHGPDPLAIERFISRAKPQALDPAGLLTPVRPVSTEELGGLAQFKLWLARRSLALHPRARQAGIPNPRGVLLLGVQGCGKSLAARVCASVFDVPLLRLEPGRLFGGTVGESEANLRRATAAAERIAPVVLWLDEIDKGLAGSDGASSDAGTAARVVGGLLTWMQERERPVFVVATANRVDGLPPELLRRGRLDEIFFVDLPDGAAREEILRVHLEVVPLRELGLVPPAADEWAAFAEVARGAEGFSGAELEAALVEARLAAFAQGRNVGAEDLRSAVESTVPLSVARREAVESLRSWASGRARSA